MFLHFNNGMYIGRVQFGKFGNVEISQYISIAVFFNDVYISIYKFQKLFWILIGTKKSIVNDVIVDEF